MTNLIKFSGSVPKRPVKVVNLVFGIEGPTTSRCILAVGFWGVGPNDEGSWGVGPNDDEEVTSASASVTGCPDGALSIPESSLCME